MDAEERKYCCLTLLLYRVGLVKLRQFFINRWDALGGFAPWTDCPQNGADLLTKFKPLPYEKDKVKSGDTTTWDLSIFFKALLKSSPPFVHFPERPLIDGLICLKETRNILSHTESARIKSTDYPKLKKDVCKALELLGACQNDFKKVEEDVQQPVSEVLSLVKQCASQDIDILNGIGTIHNKLDEILKGIKTLQKRPQLECRSEDLESYSANLKEAVIKKTDLLSKGISKSRLKTEDIFTNLTVYQGKQKSLQERVQEDHRTRKTVTEIDEIFVGENEDNPKTILVSGEPGIGKTMFSHKILRDWSTNCISIPNIKFTYLITFRQLVMLGNKELTLRELLNRSPLLNTSSMMDDTVMAHAIHHSEQFFVVLDGFDEYKDPNKILGSYESQFSNDAETKMPIAALMSKLIRKKILCDSVIMITSRLGEDSKLDEKLHFDRYVEITGFSEEQVLKYVEKYFNSKPDWVKKMAMEKVKRTAHYMSFGRVPLRCLFVCQVIEYEIQNKITKNSLVPLTLTQFYRDIISCLERANREMDSLDEEAASLAVEKTLNNFSELAAQLAEQNRFAFTQKDLEKLKLPGNEIPYLKSSNLIFCYPVASDSTFPQTTLEYSFSHLTIQEFFVACHLVKKRAMAAQETSDMVHIFTSGLLGLDQENNNDKCMSKVLKSVWKRGVDEERRRVVLLRCLHEYGLEKEFTRQELTTNRDYRYWYSYGWIVLHGVTDTDCDALAMLLESTATSISSPPHRLHTVLSWFTRVKSSPPHALNIRFSQITITMLNRLLSSLHSNSTITVLCLLWCSLNDDHVKCLCKYLINTHITSLSLSNNNISDVGVDHIVHSNIASKLTHLTLSHNNITDVGVDHIVHSNIASKLTYLDLLVNPVSVEVRESSKQFCQVNYPGLGFSI